MRFVIDRCDVCRADYDVQYPRPIGWITWKIADLDEEDVQHERHFCSEKCLRQYLQVPVQQEPQDKPACKARRFLLVDGETADITECVKWGNGRVTIEPPYDTGTYTFPSWDRFKETYPGCGVQWIDQEVSE